MRNRFSALILALLFLLPSASYATVAESTSRIQAACNGSTTAFPFTFNAASTSEIQVVKTDSAGTETVLTVGTDYTTACTNDDCSAGGTVTVLDTCASGYTITILRDVGTAQESDYTDGMPALYETFEADLDKQTRINQEQDERLARALQLKKSDTVVSPEVGRVAGGYLRWDSTGTDIESASVVNDSGSFLQSGTDAVSRTVSSKLSERVSPEDFEAAADGVTDDSDAWASALAYLSTLDNGTLSVSGSYFLESGFTIPSGVTVDGGGNTYIKFGNTGNLNFSSNTILRGVKCDFDSKDRTAIADTVSNVTVENSSFTGSNNNGLYFLNSTNITTREVIAYSNTKRGIYTSGCTGYKSFGCTTYSNGLDGQATQDSSIIQVDNPRSYSNGTTANSGLSFATSSNITVNNPVLYSNFEHGIGFQNSHHWTVNGGLAYSNGSSGLNCQSDSAASAAEALDDAHAARNGAVTGFYSYANVNGLTLKEGNKDITFASCQFKENTSYQIRLVDIAASGYYSQRIQFIGCDWYSTVGSGFVNSNDSLRISRPEAVNYSSTIFTPSRLQRESIASASEIVTTGAVQDYPEYFTLTGTTAIQNTDDAEAIAGRRITLKTTSGLTIEHNNVVAGKAAFLNTLGADVVLPANGSITYVGDGSDWVESAGAKGPKINVGAKTELTIASGAVTATRSFHSIDTEADAAADDLTTINGGVEGDILVITAQNGAARAVTVKDGGGNIRLNGDFIMNGAWNFLPLIYHSGAWNEFAVRNSN